MLFFFVLLLFPAGLFLKYTRTKIYIVGTYLYYNNNIIAITAVNVHSQVYFVTRNTLTVLCDDELLAVNTSTTVTGHDRRRRYYPRLSAAI